MAEIGGLNSSLLFPVGGNSLTPARGANTAMPRADELGAGNDVGGSKKSFADTLKDTLQNVNDLHKNADDAVRKAVTGEGSVHDVMIAMEKADIALKQIQAIRGKLVDAYNEIIRMQV